MKRIMIVLLICSIPALSNAQGPISFGPKLGWNSDRLTTDYTDYLRDIKNGGQGGFFLSLYINKFYLQPEVYLSIKQGGLTTSFEDPFGPGRTLTISQSVKLTTVDIPVLVGYKLIDLKLLRLRIWGGPSATYLLNKHYTLSINGENQADRIVKDDFKDAYWSAQVGAGLDVLMLTFDVGYSFGLDSFLTIQSLDRFNLRSNTIFCSLGWRLF